MLKLGLAVFRYGFVVISLFQTASAAERQTIPHPFVAPAAGFTPVAPLAPSTRLELAIGLPLRNQGELTNLLQELYDPASPRFHQWLTPDQFTERFGPSHEDYAAVAEFMKSKGLVVARTHPNRLLLHVSGSISDIERTFRIHLSLYEHPTEPRLFYAPDTQPSVDLTVPILDISGLDDFQRPHPMSLRSVPPAPLHRAHPNLGSGQSGSYIGNDFRAAYAPGVTLNGAGQSVGLLEFDGYYASDITKYEVQAGLPSVTLSNVLVGGFSGKPGANNSEVALDIEVAISMAPGLSKVFVYEESNPGIVNDILSRMANDNLAKQLSCSWGGFSTDGTTENLFLQFATQGQSFFQSSGDDGAYVGAVTPPADDPYITVVGGTTLSTSGPGGAWVSEVAWNWSGTHGTGGGISTTYLLPSWQTGISMSANQGSTSHRNSPDVAMVADNVLVIYSNGKEGIFGGTSISAPLWAGFTALINQQAVAHGQPTLGFINPAVYNLGKGAYYTSAFHDVSSGNNTNQNSPTLFFAVSGYDLCTGWGTPAGSNFINALAPFPPTITLQPSNQTALVGATVSFQVAASGSQPLSYQWWFNGATLAGATASTLNLTDAQTSQAGPYQVVVTNFAGAVTSSVAQLTLSVPPSITTQPTNQAVAAGATVSFQVAASGTQPLSYQWMFNGANLTSATSSTLILSGVQPAVMGGYSAVVTNTAGAVTSIVASLTVNASPVLAGQANRLIDVLTLLTVTNTAVDTDVPAQTLTYQLLSSPSGAAIDTNGIITWSPAQAQGASTNVFMTVVTDNGIPPLSATNSFTVWVSGLYLGINLQDTNQAVADLDNDGLSNLMEYALGTDPRNPADSTAGIKWSIAQASAAQYITMTFKRRLTAIGLQYIPEVSADMVTWYSDTAHVQQTGLTPLDAQFVWVTVQDQTPLTNAVPRFLRLRVVEN